MLRQILFATAASLVLGLPAAAQTTRTIKSIDVTADLAAVANPTAAAYWATLETDLEAALATRLSDHLADKGTAVEVDVEEVELSNGFTEQAGLADTRLVGKVRFRDDTDGSKDDTYTLRIDVNQARPLIASDVDLQALPAGSHVYYDAMISAFADAVVDRLY